MVLVVRAGRYEVDRIQFLPVLMNPRVMTVRGLWKVDSRCNSSCARYRFKLRRISAEKDFPVVLVEDNFPGKFSVGMMMCHKQL